MSLVRLLEMGRSLNAINDTQSRYRMQSQNLLPKFGMAGPASGFHSMAAEAPSNSTVGIHHLRVPGIVGASNGEGTGPRLRKTLQAFLSPLRRTGGFFVRALKLFSKWAIATGAFRIMARKYQPTAIRHSKPFEAQFQAELSLDNVTVVRNDLSDADLQVVPVQAACKSSVNNRPVQPTAPRGQVNVHWKRLTSRLFRMPIGYQDETGFHQGVTPAKEEVGWPPFW